MRASSGNDRHDQLADFRVAQQFSQQTHENHGGRNFAAFRAFVEFLEVGLRNRSNGLGAHFALRQVTAQLFAAFLHIADFRTVISGTMERRVLQFFIGDGNPKARAEHAEFVFVQLFLLVGDVLALAGLAQPIALDGLGQDDGGRSLMFGGGLVGSVNLDGIVTAEPHTGKLFVGKMLDHLQQAGIAAEQVVAEVGATLDEIFLVLAIRDLAHALDQDSVTIVADEVVPIAAPDHLDHVPACAAENRFQFLDDFAVAAYRSIQTLQVAVDYKRKIVEALARGQRDRAEGFGLIHLAVAHKGPDSSARGCFQTAVFQITNEPRLVNGLDRTQPHADRRKFPEIWHQPRVGIRGKAAAFFQFAAEVLQFFPGNAAFKKSSRIDAGRGVSLEINQVAIPGLGLRLQEVVKSDLVEGRGRGKSGDVSADPALNLVGPHHHGQGVPAHQALDAALHLLAARKGRLLTGCNRVLVGSGCGKGKVYAGSASRVQRKLLQQASGPLGATLGQYVIQRIQPLPGFKNFHSVGRLRLSHVWFSPSMNAEPSMIVNYPEFCWPTGAWARKQFNFCASTPI